MENRRAIETLFDINIICDRNNGGKYSIEQSDEMNKSNVLNWMLSSFMLNNMLIDNPELKLRILTEKIPSGQKDLNLFFEAMRDKLKVEIKYKSFQQEKELCIEIEPYCFKLFKQRGYIVARNSLNKIRTYSLDRMNDVRITKNHYTIPRTFKPEEHFKNFYGIYVDDKLKPREVKIKVYDDKRNYVESLPLHHSQIEIEKKENYSVFSYNICPTVDFIQEILIFGDKMEVLSPQSFRNEIAETVKNMYNRYSTKIETKNNKKKT